MLTTYTLTLAIDEAHVRALAESGATLVLAKSARNAKPNLAWLAWTPASENIVRWDETYGVYAAEAASAEGRAPRILDSVHPAADRRVYPFHGTAFGPPSDGPRVPHRHYDVRNAGPVAVAFGLLQDAVVNGATRRSPVNAVVLPPTFTADFTAVAQLYIWTHGSEPVPGAAPDVPDDATIVTLDPARPIMAYRYEETSATFVRSR
ncbi:MAG: hypothetical protein QOJ39_1466 [Candidatus Eremiobacteraeota bacterium]|jgi:hypothetical protein|nr:hypothetical protein [Candidatus Eremiobacteraeota bacterium]